MKFMLLGIFIISSTVAQVPIPGKCPNVQVVPNFDVGKYLGKWYEAERYFAIFEITGKCVTADYSSEDNGTVSVLNKQISVLTGIESSIVGYAMQKSSEKAKLTVVFPTASKIEGSYWVLDTDYTSYAVVWSCTDIASVFSIRFAWILTRQRNSSIAVIEKAYQALDKNDISRRFFIKTNQIDCPAEH
ncbi:apolipoprotein D-like [Phymastichus coffea]|uniref:apolipoprotein D-like n=1 Tax=Phymastichus coffea TaxID=108790 RepID=UPI00273A896A|nr:apolipoprotein D-like [Phymastichus coffea]